MYWKFNKVTPSQSFEKFYTTIFHHLVIDPLLKSHHPTLHDPTQSYPILLQLVTLVLYTHSLKMNASEQLIFQTEYPINCEFSPIFQFKIYYFIDKIGIFLMNDLSFQNIFFLQRREDSKKEHYCTYFRIKSRRPCLENRGLPYPILSSKNR